MAKKYFCDKCEKVIEKESSFLENFDMDGFQAETGLDIVIKPELCSKCTKEYNKLIKETNSKIREFLN